MLARFVSIVILWLLIDKLAIADARLGGSISDFRSRWGSPSHEEVLIRTATLKWNKPLDKGKPIGGGVFAIEVAFLDKRACEIVLRLRQKLSGDYLSPLVGRFVKSFQGTKMPKPRSNFPNSTVHELKDHTIILVNKSRGGDVIVIMGACYSQNQNVFDREAAKVRPPTSNH